MRTRIAAARPAGTAVVLATSSVLLWVVGETRADDHGVAASTLAVAALFVPARRRIQAVVDHRFNREPYDAQRIVEAFTQRLRDEVELATVRELLATTANSAIKPRTTAVWLRGDGEAAR